MHTAFVALVGSPNSGKTTLYNWLTGKNFKTVNYPGATVEYSLSHLAPHWKKNKLIMDTPGIYSMFPKSLDEEVTLKALFEHPQHGPVQKVVVVVDATQMQRHLVILKQIQECGFECVVALTMKDLVEKAHSKIDIDLMQKELGVKVIPVDGLLGKGIPELILAVESIPISKNQKLLSSWDNAKLNQVQIWAANLEKKVTLSQKDSLALMTRKTLMWDKLFLHPVLGIVSFFVIMSLLFTSIYWVATPFMDWVDSGFGFLADQINASIENPLLKDFIANGIITSFSSVFVFVPQIFILFLGIGFLESTGYLARAATVIDKPFNKLGLTGRSFVPILSGFACAIPAMMAARNISNKRDRWITNFIVPLMSCSARLPVYALLLGFLFKDASPLKAGVSLAIIYMCSALVGVIASIILNKILPKQGASHFMMELPIYRMPKLVVITKQSLQRTKSYIVRAGPAIFVFAILIWVGTTFPDYKNEDSQVKLEQSYLGKLGKVIEPAFEPMGGDWRTGIGLLSAFAAREVFVSSMAVVMHITDEDEDAVQTSLIDKMTEATHNGRPLFTIASVVSLIIFFMIALQCMTTVAVAQKEMNSTRFAISQLVIFNVVAYVLSVSAFQILSALGY